MAIRDIQAEAEQRAKQFGNKAKQSLDSTGEVINAKYEEVQGQAREVAEKVADQTQKKPFAALGVALACGIIIGKLL